jgi:hypothetical protein
MIGQQENSEVIALHLESNAVMKIGESSWWCPISEENDREAPTTMTRARMTFLSKEEIERIHRASMRILGEIGIKVR